MKSEMKKNFGFKCRLLCEWGCQWLTFVVVPMAIGIVAFSKYSLVLFITQWFAKCKENETQMLSANRKVNVDYSEHSCLVAFSLDSVTF